MYLACLRRSYWIAALLGSVAISFRQTNAVWTFFMLCISIIQFAEDEQLSVRYQVENNKNRNTSKASKARVNKKQVSPVASEMLSIVWHRKRKVIASFTPFVTVILLFFSFVMYNGSIVVGAKDAHKVSPHFSQLLYFGAYSASILAPYYLTLRRLALLKHSFLQHPLLASALTAFSVALSAVSVTFFSIAHPYLLADNRHYTFYIWKDIIKAHWSAKYLLLPFYLLSWSSILHSLSTSDNKRRVFRASGPLWTLAFIGATAATVVPAPLIELRYYTVPFYILALRTLQSEPSWKLLLVGVAFLLVNIVTMALFLFKPFQWPHEAGTQRFLW